MQASQGRKAGLWRGKRGTGEHRGDARGRGGEGRCAEGDRGWHTERHWPARPPETEVRPQKGVHPILRNHLQKLTDLNENPGVHQTAPETSVQLCTPGWSRVPGEKMLSGKTPGSELGEQRQTNDRESQGRLDARKPLPPGLCGHMSCQRESSMWPSNSCSHQVSI